MATTYESVYFKDAAFYHPTGGGPLVGRTTTREYVTGDIVKLHKIERDTKLGDVVIASDRMDTNATPTLAGVLEITDGTTPTVLATLATTFFGSATAATRIARLDNPAALGYVTPTRGFYLQVRMTASPATSVTGVISFSVERTNVLTGAESPLVPTG
jgi:hypothetical protein